MITIQIDRNKLTNGMWDIEDMIADAISNDLGAKKVKVSCITRNWQGHICPEFKGSADGVKIMVQGEISPYDLDADPWCYPMDIYYDFAD